MNYQLAKQLKESGFPQKGAFGHQLFASGGGGATVEQCNKYPDLVAYAPSLEELIVECGNGMHALIIGTPFLASGCTQDNKDGSMALNEYGSTPKEAVAKLWLALNTKPI